MAIQKNKNIKKYLDELTHSDFFFKQVLEQNPVSTWIADAEGTNIRQNRACRQLFGIKKDSETVGKYNLFKDEILKEKKLIPKIKQVFKKGKAINFELEYSIGSVKHVKVPGAKTVFLEVNIYPIKNEAGNVVGAIVQHKDNTAIRYYKDKMEKALSSSGIGVWDWDIVGNELIWDDAMYELYGVSKNKFKGAFEAWEKTVHPDDLKKSKQEIDLALKGKKDFRIEFRVITETEEIRHLKGTADVIRDEKGRPIKMIGTNWDITKEKENEIKIKESETRFRELFDNMRSGVAIFGTKDDGKTFYFKDFNKKAEELEGIKKEKIINQNIKNIFPGIEGMGLLGLLKKVYKEGKPIYDAETKYIDGQNRISYRENYIYKLSGGDIISIYNNVTSRVAKVQELEKVNTLLVGRELKMIQLKKEIKTLKKHVNQN